MSKEKRAYIFQAEIEASHDGEAWEIIENQIQDAIDKGYSAAYPFELYRRLPSGEDDKDSLGVPWQKSIWSNWTGSGSA